MSGTGVWDQDIVVSLCCSLFLTFFFHCCFLLTNFLYSTMVSLWATISLVLWPLQLLFSCNPLIPLFLSLSYSLPVLSGVPSQVCLLPFSIFCFVLSTFSQRQQTCLVGFVLARGGSTAEPAGIGWGQHKTALTSLLHRSAVSCPGGVGSTGGQNINCPASDRDVGLGRSDCIIRGPIWT